MKTFVFFLTLLIVGFGAFFVNLPSVLAINYYAPQTPPIDNTVPVKVVKPLPAKVATQKVQNAVATNASCLAKQDTVKNRMTSLVSLATGMENQFDAITQRTVDYYNNTLVPSGKSVPNYNTLIANIQTSKDTIQAALNISQTNLNNFNCTSGNPKLLLTQFRINMQTVKIDLRNYRASIKNLIAAIKSVSPTSVNKIQNNQ